MQPIVAIIILNWNGWRDTVECLESIWHLTYRDYWVIVVDNGSTDDSLSRIREYCAGSVRVMSPFLRGKTLENKPVEVFEYGQDEVCEWREQASLSSPIPSDRRLILIRNNENLGFAEGNSIGIRFAEYALQAEFLFLLNNDTVVDSNLLDELVTAGKAGPDVGVVGPKMYYYDLQGRRDVILYAGARIVPWREIVYRHIGTGEVDIGQYDTDSETDWCSGAGMMISAELYRHHKLNIGYRFGNEDAEYCIRARRLGWKVVYVHRAKMWHKVGASRKSADQVFRRGIATYFRFIRSNFSLGWYLYHVFLFVIVVMPKWFFMFAVHHGDGRAIGKFFSELRSLLE